MDPFEYFSTRVRALLDHSDDIYHDTGGPTNEFDTWSALKLIHHSNAVATYTRVHDSQGTGDIFYIDALAGTGLSQYEDGYFLGSALLAARAATTPFTKMYFVEEDGDSAAVLEERLEYAFDLPEFTEPYEWDVYPEDANKKLPEIASEIKDRGDYDEKFNYYAFIDNQAADVKWNAIEALTPKPYGDLLINIPTGHTIGRNINKDNTDELNDFFGEDLSDVHYRSNVRSQSLDRYLNNLAARGRSKQVVTEVHSGVGSFHYDLAYVTRKTGKDNPWLDAIRYTRSFVERYDGDDIGKLLDIIKGDQEGLKRWVPDDDEVDEEVFEELADDHNDPEQSSLKRF